MTRIKGPHGDETESWVNQRRDEPMPASHHDDPDQAAVARNEEHAAARTEGKPGKKDDPASPERRQGLAPGEDEGPGKAIRDMMPGGPGPQGDVQDAPAVQVATAEDTRDARDTGDDAGDRPGPPRLMSNAAPGKPDGEVDTRP